MSKALTIPPYELKKNFKKCPVCRSKNIHVGVSVFFLTCEDCDTSFFRRVSTDNPKDSTVVLYLPRATHPFVALNSKEVVTFT